VTAAAPTLQARRDRTLREQLGADSGVKAALRRLRERGTGYGFRSRRDLLAGALRLTRGMAPVVAEALSQCRDALGFKTPVEVYVRPDPMFNAFCVKNPSGPIIIGMSSRLLEGFSPAELRFVLGHEMGHAAFDHFGLPMPITAMIEDMAGIMVSRPVQLQLYVWCRAAEVSADRAGLVCARDPEVAASAFFKLASGLSSGVLRADLEAFASQVESLASAPAATIDKRGDDDTLDCFSTHPYTPVRVRALLAFARSRGYAGATGQGPGDLSDDQVEEIVERELALMEPTYLEEKGETSALMRRLLYLGGVSVAAANGEITEQELSALRALLGDAETEPATDLEAVRKELEKTLGEAAGAVSLAGRAQLVQHLTVIAAADGVVDPVEHDEMVRLALALGVDPIVVAQTLRASAAPMD
jgi:uncharacterized tellurite resistance protein B-like protein